MCARELSLMGCVSLSDFICAAIRSDKGIDEIDRLIRKAVSSKIPHPLADHIGDIVNDVWVKLLPRNNQVIKSNPQAYIYTIAQNAARDFLNRHFFPPLYENFVQGQDNYIYQATHRMILLLPNDGVYLEYKVILKLTYEKRTSKEISMYLGLSPYILGKRKKELINLSYHFEMLYDKLLGELSEQQRKILRLAIEELTQKEIARVLGLSAPRICQHLSIIRDKFRTILYRGLHNDDDDPNGGIKTSYKSERTAVDNISRNASNGTQDDKGFVKQLLQLPFFLEEGCIKECESSSCNDYTQFFQTTNLHGSTQDFMREYLSHLPAFAEIENLPIRNRLDTTLDVVESNRDMILHDRPIIFATTRQICQQEKQSEHILPNIGKRLSAIGILPMAIAALLCIVLSYPLQSSSPNYDSGVDATISHAIANLDHEMMSPWNNITERQLVDNNYPFEDFY